MATMSAFTAVNSSRELDGHALARIQETTTPTTPRPSISGLGDDTHHYQHDNDNHHHHQYRHHHHHHHRHHHHQPHQPPDDPSAKTPTRGTFSGLDGQRSLPASSPAGASVANNKRPTDAVSPSGGPGADGAPPRALRSKDDQDVDMDDSDDDPALSENDDDGGEGGRPSKKKKGQRFFCTDFPPCKLSFTRSEHLARHIRKHTGERPFQCHCARRFSRLDNLRQHAQTVHVNEEIPTDSLAATGTRFQRQVRTDRVRPGAARPRASTMGSQSSHGRGHSRNLSTSSIGSTASSISYRDDVRRRPPPLVVANHRASQPSLSIDTYRSPPDSPGAREAYQAYSTQSPADYSTPTSATYSTGPGSPRFPTTFRSPTMAGAPPGGFWESSRAPSRRLSVPSSANPFQSPPSHLYHQPYFSPLPSSHASTFSGRTSAFGSPTSSIFSPGRPVGAPDVELKRRTWHPESRPTVNSPLANSSVAYLHSNLRRPTLPHGSGMAWGTRLPGIESFDHFSARPSTPPRRQTSPMQLDTPSRPPAFAGPAEPTTAGPDHRRGVAEWDLSLHKNLNRLGINSLTPPTDVRMPWPTSQDTSRVDSLPHAAPEPAGEARPREHPSRPDQDPGDRITAGGPEGSSPGTASKPVETPKRSKRHGWYNGPLSAHRNVVAHRTSPEDSSSSEGVATPSTSSVGEPNPSIQHSNGWPESNPSTPPVETPKAYPAHGGSSHAGSAYSLSESRVNGAPRDATPRRDTNMLRLEALVAVATSEEK